MRKYDSKDSLFFKSKGIVLISESRPNKLYLQKQIWKDDQKLHRGDRLKPHETSEMTKFDKDIVKWWHFQFGLLPATGEE